MQLQMNEKCSIWEIFIVIFFSLQSIHHILLVYLQAMQLLVCDWLLNTRTEIWQAQQSDISDANDKPSMPTVASSGELAAFQQDLSCLRKLSQHLKSALPRVRMSTLKRLKSKCSDRV